MNIEDYHNDSALGSTLIKEMLKSPAHFAYKLTHKIKPSDAMILGDAIHAYILEPDRFNAMYTETTEVYKRASGTAKAGDVKTDEDGCPLTMLKDIEDKGRDIKGDQYKKFACMRKAIDNNAIIKDMLANHTHIEHSLFGTMLGINIKCRPDIMDVNRGIIWDVKTVGSKSDTAKPSETFIRNFIDLGYDVQASLYRKLCEKEFGKEFEFRFLCVDVAKDVCGIKEWKLTDELLELGDRRLKYCLEKIKEYNQNPDETVYPVESEDLKADYRTLDLLEKYRCM